MQSKFHAKDAKEKTENKFPGNKTGAPFGETSEILFLRNPLRTLRTLRDAFFRLHGSG
jgi:hypothetical protein